MRKPKIKDPLFYISLVTFGFWLADAYLKIFILGAPSRMLWYSAVGLFITTIGLFRRSSLLLTAMFCALAINESIWIFSLFSHLLFNADITHVTDYVFRPNYPRFQFFVTMYHLTLVPSLTIGLFTIRKVHRLGWVAAGLFALSLAILTYIFPDPKGENVNCIQRETIGSCRLYFSHFYQLDNFRRIFLIAAILTNCVYLPINYLLLFLSRILGWQKE